MLQCRESGTAVTRCHIQRADTGRSGPLERRATSPRAGRCGRHPVHRCMGDEQHERARDDPDGRAHQPPWDRDRVRRLRRGGGLEGPRQHGLSLPPRRHGPADPGERGRGRVQRRARGQDRLLPQRRHPRAARGAGGGDRRDPRRRLRAGERRRATWWQAGDREVPPRPDGPRGRGPLPQSGVPDLREPDRVPRRRREALWVRARTGRLPPRFRSRGGGRHAAHEAAHLQQPPQPDGRGELRRGDRGAGRPVPATRSPRTLRRGLLGRALLRAEPVDRPCPAWPSAPSSCTPSARSTR